jgi:hypothetical protein
MKKNIKLRIGNISFEYKDFNDRYEILKYEKNPYYEKYDEYTLDESGEHYTIAADTDGFHTNIHKSCFKNPEMCYLIAHFDIDEEGGNLVWCGSRPLKLDRCEWEDFMGCITFGYDYIEYKIDQSVDITYD